jgi:hypothetical protein
VSICAKTSEITTFTAQNVNPFLSSESLLNRLKISTKSVTKAILGTESCGRTFLFCRIPN